MTDDLTEMDDPAVLAERARLRCALDRTPTDEQPGMLADLLADLARVEHEIAVRSGLTGLSA
jgi:hypothetical protein